MVGLVNHSLLRNGIQILEEYQQSVFFIYLFVDSQAVGSEIIDLELILCRNENDRKNQDVEKNGHICRKEKNVLFDWQNRQSSITTFSWWIKDESKFCRKNANAQLYSFRKTKLENFWSQVMEAGKINFPNCTKPPKSQNEKKLKLLKPHWFPSQSKILIASFHSY